MQFLFLLSALFWVSYISISVVVQDFLWPWPHHTDAEEKFVGDNFVASAVGMTLFSGVLFVVVAPGESHGLETWRAAAVTWVLSISLVAQALRTALNKEDNSTLDYLKREGGLGCSFFVMAITVNLLLNLSTAIYLSVVSYLTVAIIPLAIATVVVARFVPVWHGTDKEWPTPVRWVLAAASGAIIGCWALVSDSHGVLSLESLRTPVLVARDALREVPILSVLGYAEGPIGLEEWLPSEPGSNFWWTTVRGSCAFALLSGEWAWLLSCLTLMICCVTLILRGPQFLVLQLKDRIKTERERVELVVFGLALASLPLTVALIVRSIVSS